MLGGCGGDVASMAVMGMVFPVCGGGGSGEFGRIWMSLIVQNSV